MIQPSANSGLARNSEVIKHCLARPRSGPAKARREVLRCDTTDTELSAVGARQFSSNFEVAGAFYTTSVYVVWSALPEKADRLVSTSTRQDAVGVCRPASVLS